MADTVQLPTPWAYSTPPGTALAAPRKVLLPSKFGVLLKVVKALGRTITPEVLYQANRLIR